MYVFRQLTFFTSLIKCSVSSPFYEMCFRKGASPGPTLAWIELERQALKPTSTSQGNGGKSIRRPIAWIELEQQALNPSSTSQGNGGMGIRRPQAWIELE